MVGVFEGITVVIAEGIIACVVAGACVLQDAGINTSIIRK